MNREKKQQIADISKTAQDLNVKFEMIVGFITFCCIAQNRVKDIDQNAKTSILKKYQKLA